MAYASLAHGFWNYSSSLRTYQGEECEDEVDELVDEFNVQEDLARNGVVGLPQLAEVQKGVDRCKEGAV